VLHGRAAAQVLDHIALVVSVAVVAYRHVSKLDESERWVLHTHEVVEHPQSLLIRPLALTTVVSDGPEAR
jgi:hypothetical protein